MSESFDNEPLVELAAEAAHEANKEYCESIGDDSQVDWAEAPEWQRESAINGVRFILDNPTAPPSSLHENWRAVKTQDGWTYGPVKDVDNKLHPCMLPFNQLPEAQQKKDEIFFEAVTGVLYQTAEDAVAAKVAE